MKKTREQKGITLIALIITIVVLLILAAVTISSIQNDGIIAYAQNASSSYNQAQDEEENMLTNYYNHLNNYNGENNVQDDTQDDVQDDTQDEVQSYTVSYEIGSYHNVVKVEYSTDNGVTWTKIGANHTNSNTHTGTIENVTQIMFKVAEDRYAPIKVFEFGEDAYSTYTTRTYSDTYTSSTANITLTQDMSIKITFDWTDNNYTPPVA